MNQTKLRDANKGSFGLSEHHEFVRDTMRVSRFKDAIEKLAPGKVILDAGTGSGIMAIIAAKAGAKRVIAIEKDARTAELAGHNFARSSLSDRIELIEADIFSLRRGDLPRVDLLIGEMLSTWCVVEPQVPAFNHLFRILPSIPMTIPRKVMLFAQGVNAAFSDDFGLVEVRTPFFEFPGIGALSYGITGVYPVHEISLEKEVTLLQRFAFTMPIRMLFRLLPPHSASRRNVNALRLTSPIELADGIVFDSTHSLMPPVVVPLPAHIADDAALRRPVSLEVEFTIGGGWENFHIREPG